MIRLPRRHSLGGGDDCDDCDDDHIETMDILQVCLVNKH